MHSARFYQVTIWPKGTVKREQVDEALNRCYDWYRYNSGHYVVYTALTAQIISERLQPLAEYLFVCRLDKSDMQGWMPKAFWEWLNKERNMHQFVGE